MCTRTPVGPHNLRTSRITALLFWKDLTSVNVSQGTKSGDGVHTRSTSNSSLCVGSETTSELASSPEVQQLLRDMQTLRSELKVLKEERSLAPDVDCSAGGRRLDGPPSYSSRNVTYGPGARRVDEACAGVNFCACTHYRVATL